MTQFSHEEIKREIIKKVYGDPLTLVEQRLARSAPSLFNDLYYSRITDPEKKEIVKNVLIEILTDPYFSSDKRLRCCAAYVAGDIYLEEAKPHIVKLAHEKKIQNSYWLIFIEHALEKLGIPFSLTCEQLKRVVIGHLHGKCQPVQCSGEAMYDFKRFYYDKISDPDKKEMVKKVLLEILTTRCWWLPRKKRLCSAAYVAGAIGIVEAKPIIEKMASEEFFKRHSGYHLIVHALEKLKRLH